VADDSRRGAPPVTGREERRLVTALFVDLRGSTSLAEQYDVEDVRELLAWFVDAVISVVEAYGGVVKDLAGDGVLALFGAPAAREDDPERAVRAGLDVQRRLAGVASRAAAELGIPDVAARVGVETGRVVAGPVGSGGRVEYGVTGDAVNVAARLQGLASAGGVLVGPVTVRQVGARIRWGDPVELVVRGRTDPVVARQALGVAVDAAGPPRALVGATVRADEAAWGRRRERSELGALVTALAAGRGGTALLSGEPGIGKTWLVTDAADTARALGAESWWVRCTAWDRATPFGALGGLLAGYGSESTDGGTPAATPEVRRGRTLAAVRDVVARRVEAGPLCIVVEDLHWADPSTLDAVAVLAEAARALPVLLVATAREPAGLADVLGGPATVVELDLGPLPEDDARALLDRLVGPGALPADVVVDVLAASGGNPLYLHEFVAGWHDAGLGSASSDEQTRDAVRRAGIPASLERLVLARLDGLGAGQREVVGAVSVLRTDFDAELAAEVLGEPVSDELGKALDDLVDRGQLARGGGRYEFRHTLVRDVAEASLLRGQRRDLNRRAAEAVLRRADGGSPGRLAAYWERAGEPALAYECHLAAERAAASVSALPESLAHVEAACRLAPTLDLDRAETVVLRIRRATLRGRTGDATGARSDAAEAAREAALLGRDDLRQQALEELALALEGAVDYEASVRVQQDALDLARARGDTAGVVRGHARLAINAANRLRYADADEHARSALELAAEAGDDGSVATALDAAKQVALQLGDGDRMEQFAERLSSLDEAAGDTWREQFVQIERGYLATNRGRWAAAESMLRRGLALNREIGDLGNEPMHLAQLSALERVRGRYAEAAAYGERAVAEATRRGHAEWVAWAQVHLAQLHLDVGQWRAAAVSARSAADAAASAHVRLHEVRAQGALARALAAGGDQPGAEHALEACRATLRDVTLPAGSMCLLAWDAYAAVGQVLGGRGDLAAAQAVVGPVLAAARTAGYVEATGCLLLVDARLLLATREHEAARARAAEAAEIADRHGLRPVAWRAAAVLATIGEDADGRRRALDRLDHVTGELAATMTDPEMRLSFDALQQRARGDLTWL
jgi:adenylate cyclase